MWWKLGVLGTATAALLLILFAPIFKMKIKLDLPPTGVPMPVGRVSTYTASQTSIWITETVIVVIILGVAGWIAWRIVRRHRHGALSLAANRVPRQEGR